MNVEVRENYTNAPNVCEKVFAFSITKQIHRDILSQSSDWQNQMYNNNSVGETIGERYSHILLVERNMVQCCGGELAKLMFRCTDTFIL